MMSLKREITSGVAVRGDSGVASEGRLVGTPKFHSCGKFTMTLTSSQSWCPMLHVVCVYGIKPLFT